MHGSLNWFYSGADSFYGEPVYDLPLLAWGQDIPEGYAERLGEFVRLNVPDKVPLVLPPATDKSLWLNNEILRGQWLTLGDRLRMADRVISVGYSLPQTDTLTYFLLATTCIDREVVLVNTNQQTANHYEALLPGASVDRTYVDQDAVHRFAEAYAVTKS
jgi:hypothetical protein